MSRSRNAERGEGNLKLIMVLCLVAYAAFVGIKNIPIWMDVQNMKHDVDELARSAGVQSVPIEKVRAQADKIANTYMLPPQAIATSRDGKNTTVSVNIVKDLNFVFTTYKWNVQYSQTGQAW